MLTRRNFIKKSGLALGALSVTNHAFSLSTLWEKESYLPGLQLYTIRDQMQEDPDRSLKKVADIGYKLVEHATYSGNQQFYGMTTAEISRVLKDNGLKMSSGHYAFGDEDTPGTLLNGWEQAVEDAKEVGLKYMVCPSIPHGRNTDDYKKRAEDFNKAGEVCRSAGIQFCYHNHNFEFEEIDGQLPYEILLDETDSDLVKMEMDIFWVNRAGYDPINLFGKDPGRYVLWHVKGMSRVNDKGKTSGGASAITEVGNGVIDWASIFTRAKKSGMENFFVEQDITPKNPFPSIKSSLTYLQNNIL